jgi:hypothetical protein
MCFVHLIVVVVGFDNATSLYNYTGCGGTTWLLLFCNNGNSKMFDISIFILLLLVQIERQHSKL